MSCSLVTRGWRWNAAGAVEAKAHLLLAVMVAVTASGADLGE
jgi:hypothetical protein